MRLIFSAADLATIIADARRVVSAADRDDEFTRIALALIKNCRLNDAEIAEALENLSTLIPAGDLTGLLTEIDDPGILLALSETDD